MGLRVAADIGGTFTDIAIEDGVIEDGAGGTRGRRWSVKVPTTHAAPERGVLEGIAKGLAEAGRPLSDVSLVVHGTTLATNALIERKGARTALLTTEGFRDVLEMGNEGRFDQYDIRATKPAPLVPRHLRLTVLERLRHDGSVVEPLDEGGVLDAARRMRDAGVEAVAVAFLHAYADGSHEARARDLLRQELGLAHLSVSHEVSPQMREYERVSTTCANAYLQPVVSGYLVRLEQALKAGGLGGPLLMILSSGSLTTVDTASRFPIRLLESGPAGGAIFACDIARRLRLDRVLSFDVGGTTAKFCLVDGGSVRHSRSFEVARTYRFKKGSGLPVSVPVIDLVEIGAGGGSIARVDAIDRVAVGPDSAGSEPGPACYARGGTQATVTDCDLVLGKLDAAAFAGGTMPLDAAAARGAIEVTVAGRAGLSVENAAYAVAETISEAMASAARVHAAEVGTDIQARTLIAFGGAAPLHAARFAEKLLIDTVIVPAGAGVGSAIGFLRAPVAYEIVRTIRVVLGGRLDAVRAALLAIEDQARGIVAQASGQADALAVHRSAHMRYVGQGHEIEVPFTEDPGREAFGASLRAAFEAAYSRLYGRVLDGSPVEATSWTVRVQQPSPGATGQAPGAVPHVAEAVSSRRAYEGDAGAWEAWPEYDRAALRPGAFAPGPAFITEAETTTAVPREFKFRIGDEGYIWMTRGVQA